MEISYIHKRLNEIQKLKLSLKQGIELFKGTNLQCNEGQVFEKGISVIIPSYKGEQYILKCLESLFLQSLKKDLFEVILIINGEKDSTEEIVKDFVKQNNLDNIILLHSEKASASAARNMGIKHAKREYTVFIDDDDYVSKNFLEEMYRYAKTDTIVVSQIVNVDKNGNLDFNNAINNQIVEASKKVEPDLLSLNMVATINACKLIPTRCIKNISYIQDLRSGEDIVFFVELFVENQFKFTVIPINKQAIYYRVLRDSSVSRQAMTYDFFVTQRLDVIECLNQLLDKYDSQQGQVLIKQKINAQTSFINRFLSNNRSQVENTMKDINDRKLSYIPYNIINKNLADTLVIAYCFPPYADTSGNVMAKRLRDKNEIVDVVYNKMDKVRSKDYSLNSLVVDLIDERIEIPTYPSFSNWKAIDDFCKYGMQKIENKKKYKEIYSRAMWPGSHFLAYKYKLENPKVKWTAEFSDPLLLDIHGKKREAKISEAEFMKKANKLARKKYKLPYVSDDNLFFWCEYLPYIFADELVFTNEHQLKYMTDSFPIKAIRRIIKQKAVIIPQPTLPEHYYLKKKSEYVVDQTKVNIAYFGTFYSTRKLNDLFLGLENLNERQRENIVLHIFTANPLELKQELEGSLIEKNIRVNGYVDYMEFLNLTTKFDCLVVNDALTKDYKSINPYLPSKLSDYLGSGTDIWGIYEAGSILSTYPIAFKSEVGNIEQAASVFMKIMESKMKVKALV